MEVASPGRVAKYVGLDSRCCSHLFGVKPLSSSIPFWGLKPFACHRKTEAHTRGFGDFLCLPGMGEEVEAAAVGSEDVFPVTLKSLLKRW